MLDHRQNLPEPFFAVRGSGQASPICSTSSLLSPSAWMCSCLTAPSALCPRRSAAGWFAHPGFGRCWCEGARHRCCSPLQPPGELAASWNLLSFFMHTRADSNFDTSRSNTRVLSERRMQKAAETNYMISHCGHLLKVEALEGDGSLRVISHSQHQESALGRREQSSFCL